MNRCEEVLAHHGTKGMKWGIRRYQNPDGTLTAAGRRRYLGADGKVSAKGAKRMVKDYKKSLTEVARDAADKTVVNKKMVKYSEKQLKKSRESYEKSIGTNKETRKGNELKARENLHKEILKRQKEDIQTAKNLANELATKYGDKSVKSLYDKNGEFKSKDGQRIVSNTLKRFGMMAMAGSIGVGIARIEKGTAGQAKDTYKRSYVDFYNFEKTRSDVNGIKQGNATPSKKEQKSNLKELSSLAKKSGATNVIKSINKGTYDQNSNVDDNVARESKVVKKITNADSVKSAVKERDKLSEQWTKADEAFENYVKKKGLPSWDKHAEQSNDATYNRLADKVDAANKAYDKASEKLKKAVYSEVSKQTGSNPKSSDLEAIELMITRQLLYD